MAQKEKPPSRLAEKFIVRMPAGLRERISKRASTNHRSMNAEVVARLLTSLEEEDRSELGVRERSPPYQSELEAKILLKIRALQEDKQRALLKLLE